MVSEETNGDAYKEKFALVADTFNGAGSSKIAKTNYIEGFELLGVEIFPKNRLPFDKSDLKAVGVDFVVSWIMNYWQDLDSDKKKLFIEAVVLHLHKNEQVRRFYAMLCASLAKDDKESAVQLLGGVCKQEGISATKPFFSLQLCKFLRSHLLNSPKPVLFEFPLNINISSANNIALYVLAASFLEIKSKVSDYNIQFKVFRWVSEAKLHLTIPEELKSAIQNSSLAEQSSIPKIREFHPTFPEEIEFLGESIEETKVENTRTNKSETGATHEEINTGREVSGVQKSNKHLLPDASSVVGKKANESIPKENISQLKYTEGIKANETNVSGEITNVEDKVYLRADRKVNSQSSNHIDSTRARNQEQPKPSGIRSDTSTNKATIRRKQKGKKSFVLFDAVAELRSYLDELEISNRDFEIKIVELQDEKRKLQELDEKLQIIGARNEEKYSDLKNKFNDIRGDLSNTKKDLKGMKNQNDELRQRESQKNKHVEELKELLDLEKKKAEDEARRLSKRIDPLSDQKVVEFRNRIIESLRPDHLDLNEIKGIDMTVNVGNSLRSLLFGIFEKLKDEGIDFIPGDI